MFYVNDEPEGKFLYTEMYCIVYFFLFCFNTLQEQVLFLVVKKKKKKKKKIIYIYIYIYI